MEEPLDAALRHRIVQDCIALSSAFAHHLDQRDYAAVAELFVPDGVWVRLGVRLEGHDAILTALARRPASQFTRHVTTSHHFTRVEADTAAAMAYNMSWYSWDAAALPADFVPAQAMLLDVSDRYVRTGRGWRFALREIAPVLIPADARAKLAAAH